MTRLDQETYYRKKADAVLFGEAGAAESRPLLDVDDGLAKCFVKLLILMKTKIRPVNERALLRSSDPVAYLAQTQGVRFRYAVLPPQWYRNDLGPFVAFSNDGSQRPFVLRPLSAGGYELVDPVASTAVKVTKAVADGLSDQGLFIYEGVAGGRFPLLGTLSRAVFGARTDLVWFVLFSIVASLATMAVPVGANAITSMLTTSDSGGAIQYITLLLLCVVFAGLLVNIVVNRLRVRVQIRFQSTFFMALWDKLLGLPSGSIRSRVGELSGMMMGVLGALSSMSGSACIIVVYVVQCVAAGALMGAYAGSLIGFVNTVLAVYVLGVAVFIALRYRTVKKVRNLDIELTKLRQEMLNAIDPIKMSAAEELFYYRHTLLYSEELQCSLKKKQYEKTTALLATLLPSVGLLVVFVAIGMGSDIDLASFVAFNSAFSLFATYTASLCSEISTLFDNIPYITQLRDLLSQESEIVPEAEDAGVISGSIELSHVSFRYSEELPLVLDDLSLSIKPGEYVGVVGTSGCGKSTLLRLMLGFEIPESGSVYYDNYDLNECDKRALRRQFGVVLQDSVLTFGSIKNNIAIGGGDLEDVKRAAQAAGIAQDIEDMPMKYETVVTNESETVSGGQKQRIVIARALMNEPRVLFLDEATSALDNVAQEHVQRSLDALNVTRIVVAHRLSTIQNCDRIIVMDHGSIAEQGTFDELMELDGLFAQIARRNMA